MQFSLVGLHRTKKFECYRSTDSTIQVRLINLNAKNKSTNLFTWVKWWTKERNLRQYRMFLYTFYMLKVELINLFRISSILEIYLLLLRGLLDNQSILSQWKIIVPNWKISDNLSKIKHNRLMHNCNVTFRHFQFIWLFIFISLKCKTKCCFMSPVASSSNMLFFSNPKNTSPNS